MSKVEYPYAWPVFVGPLCDAVDEEGFVCTLREGHNCPHEAWGGGSYPISIWLSEEK